MFKKFLLATTLISSAAASAYSYELGDLNFFLKQDQKNIALTGDATTDESRSSGSTLEQEGFFFKPAFNYGLNDKITLGASTQYAYMQKVSDETTPANGRYSQDGLGLTTLNAKYRAVNTDYVVDFGASVAKNFIEGKSGDASGSMKKHGNNALDNDYLQVDASMGGHFDLTQEWRLLGGVRHQLSDKKIIKSVSNANRSIDVNSSTDIILQARYQIRPKKEFMLSAGIDLTYVGSITGSDYSQDARMDKDFIFQAKYLVTESFLFNVQYVQSHRPNYDFKALGTSSEMKNRHYSSLGFGANYLF